jgi:hypothetical protein
VRCSEENGFLLNNPSATFFAQGGSRADNPGRVLSRRESLRRITMASTIKEKIEDAGEAAKKSGRWSLLCEAPDIVSGVLLLVTTGCEKAPLA